MRERQRQERVNGPYQHGKRWRVALVAATGARRVESFATEREADAFARAAREQASSRTVSAALDEYLRAAAERGLRPSSLERLEYRLRRILDVARTGGWPIRRIQAHGAALYARAQTGAAVDTHRLDLAAGKAWGVWCTARGWLQRDPFAAVVGVGRRKRGKPQLRVDEARRLLETCLHERSAPALAVATALLLGVRATELTARQVRDLDDCGRLLWIPASKTAAGRRVLEVPPVLRQGLLELAGRRHPLHSLWSGTVEVPSRHWLGYHTERLCRQAGVPRVSPHGLRGTQATIATAAGTTAAVVSAALGHASTAITAAHYVDVAAASTARARRAEALLLGSRAVLDDPSAAVAPSETAEPAPTSSVGAGS